MISLPFRRPRRPPNIDALYGMIVAQARTPAFYRDWKVPDTLEGRLDLVVLHLVLVLRRLKGADGALPALGQALFDRFCQDIDDNFREMGVSDLAVPRQMRRVAEVFYGRAKVYEAALSANDTVALQAALTRNVFEGDGPALGAGHLAAYMQRAEEQLRRQPIEALERAIIEFPDPLTSPAGTSRPEQIR